MLNQKIEKNRIWCYCQCDCGTKKWIRADHLKEGAVVSCGCKKSERCKNYINKKYNIDGTNVKTITKKKNKNNTSGCTGVDFVKNIKKWRSRIFFKGRYYSLGFFANKEDAINARKEAEENLFGKFLEWYNSRRNTNGK